MIPVHNIIIHAGCNNISEILSIFLTLCKKKTVAERFNIFRAPFLLFYETPMSSVGLLPSTPGFSLPLQRTVHYLFIFFINASSTVIHHFYRNDSLHPRALGGCLLSDNLFYTVLNTSMSWQSTTTRSLLAAHSTQSLAEPLLCRTTPLQLWPITRHSQNNNFSRRNEFHRDA